MLHLETSYSNTAPQQHQPPPTMERRDHGRALKPLPTWTPGHNFSLAAAASGCFPWPPQRPLPSSSSSSYTCGYCRREFRSAQALGGHMNVHRRDRARLRQCCSPAWPSSLAAGPNHLAAAPYPEQQHRAPLPNLNCSPPHCAAAGTAAEVAAPVIYSFFSTTASGTVDAAAKAAAFEVSLELGIGVCGGRGREAVEEEGLDLELRLGCSCWE
ncbi:unnamed protein product [Urochloa decumbens]|uniref:C2H2-type domain-containing protein n=1 Tax=Urochloa decumbens TaxID=240449 RepID=A0ABC9D8D8_9POAL